VQQQQQQLPLKPLFQANTAGSDESDTAALPANVIVTSPADVPADGTSPTHTPMDYSQQQSAVMPLTLPTRAAYAMFWHTPNFQLLKSVFTNTLVSLTIRGLLLMILSC